jgi:hypothetical protein
VPVWAAALLLALVIRTIDLPWLTRFIGMLLALGVASLGLPTYPQVLTAWQSPDYRVQFFITLMVVGLVVGLVVWVWLGLVGHPKGTAIWRFVPLILALLCGIPLGGYVMVKPAIEALYGDALGFGSGWWVSLGAVIMLLIGAGATIMGSSIGSSSAQASYLTPHPR